MITKLRFMLFALVMLAAAGTFAQAPNISYGPEYMTVGFKIEAVSPFNSGGAVTSGFSVSPALPAGLVINSTTGVITGTPTIASSATNYTVTTSNSSGSNSAIINITVSPTPVYISYTTPQVFTVGTAITALTPVNNTGGDFAGTFYTIPVLPAGLAIDTLSGVISGTPTVASTATIYTVYYAFPGISDPGDPDDNPPVAQDSPDSTKITITVNQGVASNNASLSSFKVSNGTLSPVFATGIYNYTINVGNGLKTMTVTPTAAAASATIEVNGKAVTSGTPSGYLPLVVGPNTVTTVVTAPDGTTTQKYTLTINEARSSNDNLAGLKISASTLSPVFNLNTTSYTASVPYAISSITVTPTTGDATATVTVNGKTVASGSASGAIALAEGANTISTVVTAQNGTTKTYTINFTRTAPSTNCNLSALAVSKGTLSPAFLSTTVSYSDMVTNGTTSLTITPTAQVTTSTVTVNGTAVTSGHASGPITLAVGSNTLTVIVTAQDGITKKTYSIDVTRPSTNAKLDTLEIGVGPSTTPLKPAFNPNIVTYTNSAPYTQTEFLVYLAVAVKGATATVNGMEPSDPQSPGDTSAENGNVMLPLNIGVNTISIVVTAPDGITTKTYTITVTRAASLNKPDEAVSVETPEDKPAIDDDVVIVHQGVTPNGDGINDFLQIDNITNYPDNKISILNRSGQLVYEAKGYDNATKVFDGHSNKNGQMQLPGTYFYELDYTVKGIVQHKTGYLVLKY